MKTAVYQLRLDPDKKAEWQKRAEKAGMKLGPWIESMCDRPEPHVRQIELSPEQKKGLSVNASRRQFSSHAWNCTCDSCREK